MRDLDRAPFLRESPQQVGLACLYATILQYVREIAGQLGRPTISGPVVIRSMLEAYADFCAVLIDPENLKGILATFYSEQERLLKNIAANPANPYGADIARQLGPAALKKVQADIAQLKRDGGHKSLSTKQRFARGGQKDLYEVYYWLLCLEGHNAISALEARHVVHQGPGRYELVLVKPRTAARVCEIADVLMGILIDASARLHEFLKTGRAASYERSRVKLAELRKELFPEPPKADA
jgi:hypothetical protein